MVLTRLRLIVIGSRHRKYIDLAAKIAEGYPRLFKVRMASLVVYRGEIISTGTVQAKSHPFQGKYAKNEEAIYWHAETHAIYNALKRISPQELTKATMYIARVKNDHGELVWGSAKPCSGCTHAIQQFGLKQVVYTDSADTFREMFDYYK